MNVERLASTTLKLILGQQGRIVEKAAGALATSGETGLPFAVQSPFLSVRQLCNTTGSTFGRRPAMPSDMSATPAKYVSPVSSVYGDSKSPFLIGVAGGTASGKSTVCDRIMEAVIGSNHEPGKERNITALSQDSFYRELDEKDSIRAKKGLFNFDHPDAFDYELMKSCLNDIRAGKMTRIPVYDYKTNSRIKDQFTTIYPSDVVLMEGILMFYFPDIAEMFDMKLFVDCDADTRLARRVLRDIEERGRGLETVLQQYTTMVKPAFEEFCLPTKKQADVIIPRGADNVVAISLVAHHIRNIIKIRNVDNHSCGRRNGGSTSSFDRSRSNSDSLAH